MAPLFLYLLKSSISLAILVGFYEVIQKREVFFNFNRIYFLLGLAIALLLPFWNFNFLSFFTEEVSAQNYLVTYQVSNFQLPEVVIGGSETTQSGFSLVSLLVYVYLTGVLVKAAQLLFRTISLIRLTKNTKATRNDQARVIFTEGDLPVFSFFNNIFISEKTFNSNDSEKIIAHEKVHISQLHSLDLLFAEFVCIVQWFNPFAYLLKKAIRENHEFLADEKVISAYSDPSTYRLLLLTYSSRIKTNSLAHNFSYSLLKRRLFMINKTKRPPRIELTLLGSIVAIIGVLFACSTPDVNQQENGIGKNRIALLGDPIQLDSRPEFPGGVDSLFAFLGRNIHYPTSTLLDSSKGYVMVSYNVESNGNVTDAEVVKGVSPEYDIEVLDAVLQMPNWKPGMLNGLAVSTNHKVIVNFGKQIQKYEQVQSVRESEQDTVFTIVKQMPEFPGGVNALMQYLGENIKYPEQAKKDSIQGRVFVSFVVEKDGKINEVKVLRGIGGGCDEESVRVIRSMPAWEPGRDENGDAVRVAYNIPIKYALN